MINKARTGQIHKDIIAYSRGRKLTRRPNQSYADYIDSVKESSEVVRAVKIADLRCHLANDPTPSLKKRYIEALEELTS